MLIKFIVLLAGTIIPSLLGLFFLRGEENRKRRVFLLVLSFGLFLYSGWGICRLQDYSVHAIRYIIYHFIAMISFIFFSSNIRFTFGGHTKRKNTIGENEGIFDRALSSIPHFSAIMFVIYFVSALVPFLYPSFRLLDLIQPWKLITNQLMGSDIFVQRTVRQSTFILSLASKFKLIAFPFCLIELNRKHQGKMSYFLLFVLVDMYLSVMSVNYWGRIQLLKPIFFFLTFLILEKKVKIRWIIIPSVIIFVLMTGIINGLFVWRKTGEYSVSGSAWDNITSLIEQETSMPQYYNYLIEIHKSQYITTFGLWLLNLLFPFVDFVDASFSSSRIFSESILNISYASDGFYVILPGWMGESYMIFGESLFFIGAFIGGFFLGVIYKMCSRNKRLSYYLIYLLWTLLLYLRNNTQEFIAQSFNPLIGVIVFYLLYLILRKKSAQRSIAIVESDN